MKKRVLVIAGPAVPVPPTVYGGTERIVSIIIEGLLSNGFLVDLIAAPKSVNPGGGIFYYSEPGMNLRRRFYQRIRFYYGSFLFGFRADVVLNCGRVDYLAALIFLRKKIINPFHNPITDNDLSFLKEFSNLITPVCISLDQVSNCNKLIPFNLIYNSADSEKLQYCNSSARTYFVFIGRMTRNKGVDRAIKYAIESKIYLKIAGPVPVGSDDDLVFYNSFVRPFFSNEYIEYVGVVNDDEKNNLFKSAIASFCPISWKEPFGLTVIESLLCGVPVIASRAASFPEIMQDGKTGYLCSTDAEFLLAILNINLISNSYCRQYAEERFDKNRLIDQYITLINSIL